MACIYMYEERKIIIRIQTYLYIETKRALDLKQEQEKELCGGVSGLKISFAPG